LVRHVGLEPTTR